MANSSSPAILLKPNGERLALYADYTKNVKETMPAAGADFRGVSILYLGPSTNDFTTAHVYTCGTTSTGDYTWVDVTPISSGGDNTTLVGVVTFTTDANTGNTVVLTREQLGVVSDNPEYDIVNPEGYNITADARLSRRWTADGYVLTFIGGWPAGTWQAKSCLGNTYTREEIDAKFDVIKRALQTI